MTLFAVVCALSFPTIHVGRIWFIYWTLPIPNQMLMWPQFKIPLLGDIPILGWLFRNTQTAKVRNNLVIFLTPHIIHGADDLAAVYAEKVKERDQFLENVYGSGFRDDDFYAMLPKEEDGVYTPDAKDEEEKQRREEMRREMYEEENRADSDPQAAKVDETPISIPASGNIDFKTIDRLPPDEQYRQLSLVLMIVGGAEQGLIEAIMPHADAESSANATNFDPDAYKTPLTRIVDQESMLSGAALLLRFARDSQDDIKARLADIYANNPDLVNMVDLNEITEDAIIIRNAIADSISYSGIADDEDLIAYLKVYRTRTISLRNMMEFEAFSVELDRLTLEAILAVGGKLDAYQRMFDEEVNSTGFSRQIESAEFIYNHDAEFDEKAGKMTEEIMRNVILQESQVDP